MPQNDEWEDLPLDNSNDEWEDIPLKKSRKMGGIESFIRGYGEGMVPGSGNRAKLMETALETDNADAYAALGNPLLDSSADRMAVAEVARAAESMPDAIPSGGANLAGNIAGSVIGLPKFFAQQGAKLIPEGAALSKFMPDRLARYLADLGKSVSGGLSTNIGTKALGEGQLPSADDLTTTGLVSAAVPTAFHALKGGADLGKNIVRQQASKMAGMTPQQADIYAKDPKLAKQLAFEKMHDPSALETRGKQLAQDALKSSQAESKNIAARRGEIIARSKPIELDVNQYRGSVVEPELRRMAAANPRKAETLEQLIKGGDNEGLMLGQAQTSVPSSRVVVGGGGAERLKEMASDANKFKDAYVQIGPVERTASLANKQAERSLRKALEGATKGDELKNLNLSWGKRLSDERTLKRAASSNPSSIITSPTTKSQALAQRLSPELRNVQEAYGVAKTMLPKPGQGFIGNLQEDLARMGIRMAGPSQSTQPRNMNNLAEILAAIEAVKRER